MVHGLREVVLGIPVQEDEGEADPVNCEGPANEINPSASNAIAIRQPPAIEFDTRESFETDQLFKTREDLLRWVRDVAARLRFAIVIERSDNGSDRRKQQLVLGCERGGVYKRTSKKVKFEETGTRKCQCPFRLRGYFLSSKQWSLSVVNGVHNHEFDRELDGHLIAGRLKPEEMEVIAEMTRNLVVPRKIMTTLKERDPNNVTNKKQIYNACHRLKAKVRGSRTEMQHFLDCLAKKNYVFNCRSEGDSTTVQDIFFAHPKSVALFNTFPTVLLMDSTYKTNRYGMPLFEMVGVSSTSKTFNVAFAFIKNEKEENFTWALQQCRSLLRSDGVGPKVTVTDRDTALMNAVGKVFPEASPLVCRYHVIKNVTGKAKSFCKVRSGDEMTHSQVVSLAVNSVEAVLEAETKECYEERVMEFRKVCSKFPRFVNYVQRTILDTDEKKVVKAWTNKIMHFGNITTNRAESSHGVLKKYLPDGTCNFLRVWEGIESMLTNQFSGIQTTFGQSLSVEEHRYGKDRYLYEQLLWKVSRSALDNIFHESKRVVECGMDSKKCGCVMRTSCGLPCACLLAKKIHHRLPIRLDEIHPQWKKLVIDYGEEGDGGEGGDEEIDEYLCEAEFEAIKVCL